MISLARAAGLLCLVAAPLAPMAAYAATPTPSPSPTPTLQQSPTTTPTEGPQAVSASASSLDAAVSALEASGVPMEAGENANGDSVDTASSVSGAAGSPLSATAGAALSGTAPGSVSPGADSLTFTAVPVQTPEEKEWMVAPWDVSAASAVTYTVSVSQDNAANPEGADALSAGPASGQGAHPRRVKLPRLWSESGLEYRFSAGFMHLYNGNAMSYMPLEVGWRFADGWRLRAGFEAFYYQGRDTDASTGPVPQLFYYQMTDLRLSAIYAFRRKHRFRPLAGMTIESVGALDSYREVNNSTGQDSAHSFEAPGAEIGVEYRGGPSWALSWEARYVVGLGTWANLAGSDFGVHYYFF